LTVGQEQLEQEGERDAANHAARDGIMSSF